MIEVSTGADAPYASVEFSVVEPVRIVLDEELFLRLSAYLKKSCLDNDPRSELISANALRERAECVLAGSNSTGLINVLSHPHISIRDLSHLLVPEIQPTEDLPANQTDPAAHYVQEKPRIAYVRQFRQHLLYGRILPGPIEVVQSLAPGEKIEVLLEESTSRTLETQIDEENQQSYELETSKSNSSELAENIQRTLSAVSTTRVGADGGVNFGVWSASASAEFTKSTSDVTAAQKASKFSQQITTRQSEKLQRRTKLSTRSVEQTSSLASTRRILENRSDRLMQYGFRRLNYEVVSKVQDLGYELALIFEIENPGRFLARSEFSDAFQNIPLTPISISKEISRQISVKVPSVGDWTLSYKAQAHDLLGIAKETLLKFRDKVEISSVSVVAQSGRKDWEEGPSMGIDGTIVASYRSDSSSGNPKNPDFVLSFLLSITVDEEIQLPKSVADLVQKYGQGQPELVKLLAQYSVRRRRYADGLFEEELSILLANAVDQIMVGNSLGANQTVASVCQVLDEALDLSSALYVLPRVGTLDAQRLLKDRLNSRYMIPSDPTDTQPAPMGASIEWTRVPDADDGRSRFINAPSVLLIVPIRPQHLELGLSLVNLSSSTKRVREIIIRKNRLEAAKMNVAKEDLASSSRDMLNSLEPTNSVRPWLDEENDPTEWPKWQDVYPVVSSQNVRVPVDGFAHEELMLVQQQKSSKSKKRPWWCFL